MRGEVRRVRSSAEAKGRGEMGEPRENPPTSGIVRHDSHLRKSGVNRPGIEPGSPVWEASSLTAQPPWPQVVRKLTSAKSGHSFFGPKVKREPYTLKILVPRVAERLARSLP
ncbi:hypothetical protein PR048_027199 [Dryococelus australis]|uniref:Uncharacterized protein n=1 Tax=Dryococelus australis TaxID=614101 RepID=A0ABQ9GGB4_9NEOP|nr:hypothetical protein PR048_027199 [Dryococelus australis]